jgi:hypothetical protein
MIMQKEERRITYPFDGSGFRFGEINVHDLRTEESFLSLSFVTIWSGA